MSHPHRDTRASSDTPEVPQASGSTSTSSLDVTRQQATSTEHTWQLKDYPGGPANTKSSLIEWQPRDEGHYDETISSPSAKWKEGILRYHANEDKRRAATKKANETRGPKGRRAATKKGNETRQADPNWNSPEARGKRREAAKLGEKTAATNLFNKVYGDIIDLDGRQ